jgi:DNA-binding transcriptional regulator YhcF (GntR family)
MSRLPFSQSTGIYIRQKSFPNDKTWRLAQNYFEIIAKIIILTEVSKRGKYLRVVERLSHRIRSGDYHLHGVPAERDLATEVGVSYTTIRKATQHLLDAGLLYRLPNGRLAVNSGLESGAAQKQVALLAPAFESNEFHLWNISLTKLQSRFDFGSRIVHYVHWDDPSILNTVQQFDATFLLPPNAPDEFASNLINTGKPVVILNRDWSGMGFRSLRLFPPHFIHKLLDHLASLGHRRIDCLNTQHTGPVIREWIMQWQLWRTAHDIEGELIDEPGEGLAGSMANAYDIMSRCIRENRLRSTGMLCLTETAAIGATRALLDHRMRPGHDLGIVTVGSQRCEYLSPSLTTLEEPDPAPYLAACLEWALGRDGDWHGPMLVQPPDLKVMVRESTVPSIDKTTKPLRIRRAEAAVDNERSNNLV